MLDDEKHWLLGLVLGLLIIGCTKPHATNTEAAAVPKPDAGTVAEEEAPLEVPLREEKPSEAAGVVEEQAEATVIEVPAPEPSTVPEESPYSSRDTKLAKGIYKLKVKHHHSIWWECGERYETKEDIKNAALIWAKAINEAHQNTEYKLRSGIYVRVPLKEAVGIMISESKFDRCAIGPYPRKFAYKRKILKRPPNHISHSLEEIKTVVEHPSFKGRKADIGVGQIVKKIGEGYMEWEEVKEFLTVNPGVQKVFDEMAYRGNFYSTRHPALHWPGSVKHKWYLFQILRVGIPVFGQAHMPKF